MQYLTTFFILFFAALFQVSAQLCTTAAVATTTVNAPTFNQNISTLLADVLTMGFDWGRTITRTPYPAVTTGSCVFPTVPNAYPEPPCYAAFTISTSFSALVSTPACGGTSLNVGNPSSKIWRIPVTMKANETFLDARQTTQTRSLTYNLLIQLGFPDFVTASVSITPFAPVLLDAFIISQMYTASTGKATVIFNTVVGYPFMLVEGANAFAQNLPGAIVISGTETSGFTASVINTIPSLVATGNGQQSFQTWVLTITPPQGACTFSGSYNLSGYTIACIPGATCPPINNNQASIVLQIASENFCAQTSAVIGLTSSLAVYRDPLYTLPGANFLVDDLPVQSAFFEMVVTSTAVNIRSLVIRTIVVTVTNNQNFLFAFGTPTSTVNVYNGLTWVPGINGVVAAPVVAGHARFHFDIVSALFNIPRDSLTDVLVQVTAQVFYVGSKKRDFNDLESEEVVAEFLVDADGQQKEVYSVPVGIRGPKSISTPGTTTAIGGFGTINLVFGVAIIAIALVVVSILVVLIVLLVRNKKDEKRDSAYEDTLQIDENSIELDMTV